MMKIKKVLQTDLKDCGVSCLLAILKYYSGYATREYLREITKTTYDGVSVYSLVECAETLGLEAKALKGDIVNIKNKTPFIAHILKDNKLGHFVVVCEVNDKTIKIMDPSCGFITYSKDEWQNISTNVYILYKPLDNIIKQSKNKSFLELIISIIVKYKMTFVLVILLSLIFAFSEIAIAYYFKIFININIIKLKYLLILLILIIILKELANLFRNNLINYLNHVLDNTFIKEIYNHIIKLPYIYFKNRTKGDIITRINDVFKIKNLISKLFITIFIDFISIIVVLIVIFNINNKVCNVIIIITFIYILMVLFYNSFLSKNIKCLKEKNAVFNNHLMESLSNINTIKGMVIEEMQKEKIEFNYGELQNQSFKLQNTWSKETFFKNILVNMGMIFIIYLEIIKYKKQNISELLVLYNLYLIYFKGVEDILITNLDYQDAYISFIRIKELFNIKSDNLIVDKKCINKHLLGNISIQNLEYSYNGIDDVIKCQNLFIKNGNKVLLYGNSGDGKSTLMKLLNRYLENYKGDILIDDRNLKNYNLLDIRQKITYLSSDERLYTDTVYNNIVLDKKVDYKKYLEIIKLCGVDKIIKNSLLDDSMLIEDNGYNLSNGERQRIIIARCLVKNSDIYIFDEVTNAIDIKNERILLENIFTYLKNKTIIVISHRFNNRDLYQQFIMIKGGVVYDS